METAVPVSSRLRTDIATIFDVFCEIGSADLSDAPEIISKYPEDFNDKEVLRSVLQFCFPIGSVKSEYEERFSFVLTNGFGKFTFGFCYFNPQNGTCLCMLTGLPWDVTFFAMLDHISSVMNHAASGELEVLLTRIYHTDIPSPGRVLTFDNGNHHLSFKVPRFSRPASLEEDKHLHSFFSALPYKHIIHIYASLLKERRIIFTCRRLTQLSSCVQAAAKIMYPMAWQSVYIPVLPARLIEMLQAPMPFLIGVPKQLLHQATLRNFGDLVIVDLDEKTYKSANDDGANLPGEVYAHLKKSLNSPEPMDHFKTFLQATAMIFGNYRRGMKLNDNTKEIYWSKRRFIQSLKPSYQLYLVSLLGSDNTQYMERFIEDRLKILEFGLSEEDEFEHEVARIQRMACHAKEPIDVFGTLRDKVSSMNIGEKLAKLAPKDIRNSILVTKKQESLTKTLLSFDNLQFEPHSQPKAEPPKIIRLKEPEPSNLIDLASPKRTTDLVPVRPNALVPIPFSLQHECAQIHEDNRLVPYPLEKSH